MRRVNRPRSGLALGGVGTGGFELRQDGRFYNWNIFNNAPYGVGPGLGERCAHALFFMVKYQVAGQQPRMKILQIPDGHDVGSMPSQLFSYPWMSGVEQIAYEASFPFSRLRFTDPEMPLIIDLEAFSPFIPHDVKNSSLPAAIFTFSIRSTSPKPVQVQLIATQQNLIGHDVTRKRFTGRTETTADSVLVEMGAELVDPAHDSWGTQALASLTGDSRYHMGWDHRHPFMERVIADAIWPSEDAVSSRNYGKDQATGEPLACGVMKSTLAVSRKLKPRGLLDHTFVVSWHLPNRYARQLEAEKGTPRRLEGYYYSNFFGSASEVANYVKSHLPDLTAKTRLFHKSFFASTAPSYLLDQVNSHLNTFITSSRFTRDGSFGVQEGLTEDKHWGPLATIDVSLYGAVPVTILFPELDQAMMRAHARLQKSSGEVAHGIDWHFGRVDAHEAVHGRLDLPAQYVLLAIRGALWTGDDAYLREMWPSVKRALDYVLRERDANGDRLPDMGGAMCSYDNFPMYGAASFVSSLWLAALAHAVMAAKRLGDQPAQGRYGKCLEEGRAAFESKLWNGRYYRLYNDVGGVRGDCDEGCLTDQLIGQWTMRLAGLGDLVDHGRVQAALRHIVKNNARYWGHTNCSWPGKKFLVPLDPNNWGDQGNTCWSGTELAFAALLISEGLVDDGLRIVRQVDDRYRLEGLYFDHQEYGGHYYRPMSSWALLHALLGLEILYGVVTFAPRVKAPRGKLLWATPDGYGHYEFSATRVTIRVVSGSLKARQLRVRRPGVGRWVLRGAHPAVPLMVENGFLLIPLSGNINETSPICLERR